MSSASLPPPAVSSPLGTASHEEATTIDEDNLVDLTALAAAVSDGQDGGGTVAGGAGPSSTLRADANLAVPPVPPPLLLSSLPTTNSPTSPPLPPVSSNTSATSPLPLGLASPSLLVNPSTAGMTSPPLPPPPISQAGNLGPLLSPPSTLPPPLAPAPPLPFPPLLTDPPAPSTIAEFNQLIAQHQLLAQEHSKLLSQLLEAQTGQAGAREKNKNEREKKTVADFYNKIQKHLRFSGSKDDPPNLTTAHVWVEHFEEWFTNVAAPPQLKMDLAMCHLSAVARENAKKALGTTSSLRSDTSDEGAEVFWDTWKTAFLQEFEKQYRTECGSIHLDALRLGRKSIAEFHKEFLEEVRVRHARAYMSEEQLTNVFMDKLPHTLQKRILLKLEGNRPTELNALLRLALRQQQKMELSQPGGLVAPLVTPKTEVCAQPAPLAQPTPSPQRVELKITTASAPSRPPSNPSYVSSVNAIPVPRPMYIPPSFPMPNCPPPSAYASADISPIVQHLTGEGPGLLRGPPITLVSAEELPYMRPTLPEPGRNVDLLDIRTSLVTSDRPNPDPYPIFPVIGGWDPQTTRKVPPVGRICFRCRAYGHMGNVCPYWLHYCQQRQHGYPPLGPLPRFSSLSSLREQYDVQQQFISSRFGPSGGSVRGKRGNA